jgi:hypothetical protein
MSQSLSTTFYCPILTIIVQYFECSNPYIVSPAVIMLCSIFCQLNIISFGVHIEVIWLAFLLKSHSSADEAHTAGFVI